MCSGKHLQNVKRRIFHVSRKLNPYVRLLVVCLVGKLSSRSVIIYLKGREVTLPMMYLQNVRIKKELKYGRASFVRRLYFKIGKYVLFPKTIL